MSESQAVPEDVPATSHSSTYEPPPGSARAHDTATVRPSGENLTPNASLPASGGSSTAHFSHASVGIAAAAETSGSQ